MTTTVGVLRATAAGGRPGATAVLDALALDVAEPPDRSVLVVRRLRLHAGDRAGAAAALTAARRAAARPWSGRPPPEVPAVVFADEVELLACLTRDVVAGRRAWYWEQVVRGAAGAGPGGLLAAAWLGGARWLPDALALLSGAERAGAVELLDPRERDRVAATVSAEFGPVAAAACADALLDLCAVLARGRSHPATARAADPGGAGRALWPTPTGPAAAGRPGPRPADTTIQPRPAPPAPAPDTPSPDGLDPAGAPASTAPPANTAPAPAAPAPALPAPAGTTPAAATSGTSVVAPPAPPSRTAPTPAVAGISRAETRVAAAPPATAAEPTPTGTAPIPTPAAVGPTAGIAPEPTPELRPPAPVSARPTAAAPSWPDPGVATALASALYAVPLLAALGVVQPGWAAVERLARHVTAGPPELRRAWEADPLWPLLAELDGRDPDAPSPDPAPDPSADPDLTRRADVWLAAHDLDASAFRRPGRVVATRTHVDVLLRLDQIDIRVRRAGLDQDPGWRPWLRRIVAFHFQDAR